MNAKNKIHHSNSPARRRGTKTGDWIFLNRKIFPCFGQTIMTLPAFPEEFSECLTKLHARIPVAFVEIMPLPLKGMLQYREMHKAKFHEGCIWAN